MKKPQVCQDTNLNTKTSMYVKTSHLNFKANFPKTVSLQSKEIANCLFDRLVIKC